MQDECMETLARHMLLLSILMDQSVSRQGIAMALTPGID